MTFLWSSSYILVKIGLNQLSPLTLVTLRYVVASVITVPLALVRGGASLVKDSKSLLRLVFLGLSGYTIAQGLQCLGLFYLPAVSVTFILNFTPVIVLVLGVVSSGSTQRSSSWVGWGWCSSERTYSSERPCLVMI